MYKWTGKRILALLLALALFCAGIPAAMAETQEINSLTLEQLIEMNDGNLIYTTDDEGHITFLQGKFCEDKVTDLSGVAKALSGVLTLLGGDENTMFSQAVGMQDDYGNCYYSLYQWSGDMAVQYAVVKVVTDAEGNTIALSSSLVPGKPAQDDALISPEEALNLVKAHLALQSPDTAYSLYEDKMDKAIIPYSDDESEAIEMRMVYIIYTDNPNSSVKSNDLPYLAHYVSCAGKYLYNMPVSSRGNEPAISGGNPLKSFEGMESAEYTGTVTMHDGSTKEITVPVMKDAAGTYYLADIERHIAVADCWEFMYNEGAVAVSSSPDNTGWDDKQLMAYENYIEAHDYYAAVGWYSTDGLHTPILLLADFVDENKNPVNNACYVGKIFGWQCFAATSALNNYCEALDVIGHEYTHGFTTASMTVIRYENQYGAINESMSDIMGNIMEMLTGRTSDTTWLIGEVTGEAIRSMTDPNRFAQPAYVGDRYYVPDAAVPGQTNDRGGVHVNNSLLCLVATKLCEAGMTLEEARSLWTTFICGLVPGSDYEDVCRMLPFAADLSGLSRYKEAIVKALDEIGLDNSEPFAVIKEGCGLLSMDVPKGIDPSKVQFIIVDKTARPCLTWPSAQTGKIEIILEAGEYLMYIVSIDGAPTYYSCDDKWSNDVSQIKPVVIADGETTVLQATVETVELPVATDASAAE
ncbi:MAG: M4 family metallopeptidase [Eubacteriales bacterium]|nr:M4 family metallopeptidase [Eubacteriales bacterium]MDD3881712.1 M4 family metallopeptidase [Eubacteriales bacterium]